MIQNSAAAILPPLLYHATSGNIGEVTQLSECEYDIKIRPDTNNNRHRLWFYFSVHTTLCQQVLYDLGSELTRVPQKQHACAHLRLLSPFAVHKTLCMFRYWLSVGALLSSLRQSGIKMYVEVSVLRNKTVLRALASLGGVLCMVPGTKQLRLSVLRMSLKLKAGQVVQCERWLLFLCRDMCRASVA